MPAVVESTSLKKRMNAQNTVHTSAFPKQVDLWQVLIPSKKNLDSCVACRGWMILCLR